MVAGVNNGKKDMRILDIKTMLPEKTFAGFTVKMLL